MATSIIAESSATSLISRTDYVYGVGRNDATHPVKIGGKHLKTYKTWVGMLRRRHSTWQSKYCSYIGCTVDPIWTRFSEFERWMLTQDYENKVLDKDLLLPGNKLYSEATCVFVPQALNKLLTARQACRGDTPLGVSYRKDRGDYSARVMKGGIKIHLGFYSNPFEAHKAWQLAKANILELFQVDDPRIRVALDSRAAQLRGDYVNNRITVSL